MQPDPPERPNILLVMADQLRGFDLGCAGNPDVTTPVLDAFARAGTRVRHAYANTPVCTPSRASLWTGRYPLAHRTIANDLPLPTDAVTVADVLGHAGYRTGYVGKWHLDGVPRDRSCPPGPRRHGFHTWAAYNCSHDYFRSDKYFDDDGRPVLVDGYEPVVQTDVACDFLAADDPRPFFLVVSWGPPHDPYDQVPEQYKQRYDPAALTPRPNVAPVDPGTNPLARGLDMRTTLANYYAAITALDDQMGRLLVELDRHGRAEDTIVVFLSDHGDMLWSHGYLKKQQPWEESIRVPFLARGPGIPAGQVLDDQLLGIVDVAPTLLGLAGIDRPASMQGRDLSAALTGADSDGAPDAVFLADVVPVDEALMQGLGEWRGIRTRRHTYAERLGRTGWLLYDNDEDPYQLHNLVDDPAYARVRAGLADRLHAWLAEQADSFSPGPTHVREVGMRAEWNARERHMHPDRPRLLT